MGSLFTCLTIPSLNGIFAMGIIADSFVGECFGSSDLGIEHSEYGILGSIMESNSDSVSS